MSNTPQCSHSIVQQQTVPGYIVGTVMPIWSCCDCGARFNTVPELPASEPKPSHLHEKLAAVTRDRDEARAEVERLREDAERYATVRAAAYVAINPHHKTSLWTLRGIYEIDGKDFDAAIDAARKEQA